MLTQHTGNAPPFQCPDEWNARHAIGTRVRVALQGGKSFEARTASRAWSYGCFAVLALEDREGCWLVSNLRALADEGDTTRDEVSEG